MPDTILASVLRTPIGAGMDELIIAGGVNSASTSLRSRLRVDGEWTGWFPPTHPDRPDAPNLDMSITAGWNAAVKAGVSREEMDAWALRPHRNAVRAIDEGRFDAEIVPIETAHGLFSTSYLTGLGGLTLAWEQDMQRLDRLAGTGQAGHLDELGQKLPAE